MPEPVVFAEVPTALLFRVRKLCLALPETSEQPTFAGSYFNVRKRRFAHLFALEQPDGVVTMVVCRSDPEEREVLIRIGHPFFAPRRDTNEVAFVLNDESDWAEVKELLTESFRIVAPKAVSAQL